MSFRSFLKTNALCATSCFVFAPILAIALYAPASAAATNDPRFAPTVQTFADQAAPVNTPPSQEYYDSPLAAGTLTLQDVLEAHKPNAQTPTLPALSPSSTATAPLLKPASQSSSTGLMLSQGMKEVLQKVGTTNVAPVTARAQNAAVSTSVPGQPIPLGPDASVPLPVMSDMKYEPGQEPRNLDGNIAVSAPAPTESMAAITVPISDVPSIPTMATPAMPSAPATSATGSVACDEHVQRWEKSCGDAGYPATYVGKIVGETRTSCTDGTLHDVWVTNTCTPAESDPVANVKTDAACGAASNNQFDNTPTTNLCAQGIASSVSGSGPWTWACSGVNGGSAAACTAPKRTAKLNGTCGSANGITATSAPSSDLCDKGNATNVQGSGPWTWSCKGSGGGSSQSCIAPVAAQSIVRAVPEETAAPVSAVTSTAPASSTDEKGELCGSAAETLAYEAPEKDLCRVGNASVVNGDGPWSWSCTDNDGRNSSCRTLSLNAPASAPETPVQQTRPTPRLQPQAAVVPDMSASAELACGAAASQPMTQAPAAALCENGKASSVHGSGPWRWTCSDKAHHKVSCETASIADGSCGAANGTSLKSAPFAGLCSSGTPTAIEGNGPWNWTCNGTGGGVNVSCAASLQQGKTTSGKIDGTCGPIANTDQVAAPTTGLCASGMPSPVSGEGPWTWSCGGSNGGAVSTCAAKKLMTTQAPGPTVNGLCGYANGATAASAPVEGLCSGGTATTTAGNGPWNWSCLGENGGMSVSCTAPLEPPSPIDGACGPASGTSTLVRPQSGLCSSGITGVVSGKGPWTWTCSGANGGNAASCVAPVAGRTGSMPSLTTTPMDDSVVIPSTSAAPTRKSLVTPQLSPAEPSSIDSLTTPRLKPSKSFASPPTASSVPGPVVVEGVDVPRTVPELPEGSVPVQPPALRDTLPSADVLQENAAHVSPVPGNHLTLDPTISTVLFSRGSANIDDTVLTTLDKLGAVLGANADVRITLTSYADNNDSTPRDARRLSLARALAVRDYLASKGISDSRVDVRAEGSNTTSGYIDRVDVKVNE